MAEGSLEVKLPTIWTNEKHGWEESEKRRERRDETRREEKRREEERRPKKRKSQKKEDQGARKGTRRKVAKHCVFPLICGSRGSKSRLAKAAGAEPTWADERRKTARRCGAKHISKSKCTKHTRSRPLLEVEMSKKCTPLRREAHVEVKMSQTLGVRTAFRRSVQMSFRVAGARDWAPCQKWAKRAGFVAFPKMMAGVGHLKRICKDAFSVAGACKRHVHQSC